MDVKFKYYVFLYIYVMFVQFGTNSGFVVNYTNNLSGDVRVRRQAGYVYDKPNVSFDLPTATSIATTQAPTVDRTLMQMYYAYPVPASGDTAVVNTNTGATAGATAVATSGSGSGYNYGVQNTQVTGTRTTTTQTKNTASTGYQNTANTGYQYTANTGQTATNTGYQSSAGTGTRVSSGGYGDGRPAVANTGSPAVSTSAPRYLPPSNAGQNTVVTSVTSNVATKPADTYIPPVETSPQNVQTAAVAVSKPADTYIPPVELNQQTVVTQTTSNAASPGNPRTSYLTPNTQPSPNVSSQGTVPVSNVPTQQYLPPNQSSGQTRKTDQGTVAAPAATYLPPVF